MKEGVIVIHSKGFKIILVFGVLVVAGSVLMFSMLSRNLEKLSRAPIHMVKLSEISDGSYEGEYSVFPVRAKVSVQVVNHEIREIDILEHHHGKGAKGEAITDTIISQQSLEVDAISGATYSSLVIIKAVEDALIQ